MSEKVDRETILQLINYAEENECVDFKRDFYTSLKQSDLAKDVTAFANVLNYKDNTLYLVWMMQLVRLWELTPKASQNKMILIRIWRVK